VLVTKPKIGAWGSTSSTARTSRVPVALVRAVLPVRAALLAVRPDAPVRVDIVATEGERGVLANLQRKAPRPSGCSTRSSRTCTTRSRSIAARVRAAGGGARMAVDRPADHRSLRDLQRRLHGGHGGAARRRACTSRSTRRRSAGCITTRRRSRPLELPRLRAVLRALRVRRARARAADDAGPHDGRALHGRAVGQQRDRSPGRLPRRHHPAARARGLPYIARYARLEGAARGPQPDDGEEPRAQDDRRRLVALQRRVGRLPPRVPRDGKNPVPIAHPTGLLEYAGERRSRRAAPLPRLDGQADREPLLALDLAAVRVGLLG
jgi:hypothetical protein